MNKEFFEALLLLENEKGISSELMLEKIGNAIKTAVKKEFGNTDNVEVVMDPQRANFNVYLIKEVVEEVENPMTQIILDDALQISKRIKIGSSVKVKLETKKFGRIAAQNAIQVIRQGIREAERGQLIAEFESKKNEIVSATVLRVDDKKGNVILEIGRNEVFMPKSEQIDGETLLPGNIVKVFVAEYEDKDKGVRYKISRKNAGLVKRLFEQEVPEIFDGIVEIKSISREAGSRTKIAVFSSDDNVDPIGACIGPKGRRVSSIVSELSGEKIDVVKYSEVPEEFISAALAPADVTEVEILDEEAKVCRATVDDGQLSLAIGNKGQNARLAARLTGWKIDIKSAAQIAQEKAEQEALQSLEIAEEDNEIIEDIENTEDISSDESAQDIETVINTN
ncbi:MAG: transcription termination factor NusA, partial [Oscillospiraceae bacterium]